VWELPPNGQGIIALIALNIIKGFDFDDRECPYTVHRQLEAVKMAFADARRYVADTRLADVPVAELLSDSYADGRRALLSGEAQDFKAGDPYGGGTVYLCTADAEGNMVSYIQSNYEGFGAAVVIPDTGISLNNRGKCFSLDPKHPNALMPGKRPYNTIIPGFLSKDGKPIGPFGVMGGFMQPQGHVQVVMNSVDFHMNPQEALDAPRWQWMGGMEAAFEPGFPINTAQKLERMGHRAVLHLHPTNFGRGQIIWRTEDGALAGGTEPRTDGCAEAW
jgi:gamma-glutamyltranspeptidase/glutathione hydrolase